LIERKDEGREKEIANYIEEEERVLIFFPKGQIFPLILLNQIKENVLLF